MTPDPRSSDNGSATDRRGTPRRRFLGYLVAAPTLVVGAQVAADALHPEAAGASLPSLPEPADLFDLGDLWCLSHDAGRLSRRDLLVRAARQTVLFAVALAAFTSLVPNGLGWTKGLATPGLGYTDLAPGTLVGRLLRLVVPGASFDDAATAGRLTALLAAACVIAYLGGTPLRRSLERNVGYALLVLALASPTIFPWYALWALVCIAPTAHRRERAGLIAISALASLGAITGAPTAVTTTLDLVAAAAVIVALAMRRRGQVAVAAK